MPVASRCRCGEGWKGGQGGQEGWVQINANLDIELLDSDFSLLAHAPSSPNSLLFKSRVQGGLQNEDMVDRGQVDAHTAAAHGKQEHRGWRVLLKGLYCLHSTQKAPQCC